MEKIADWQWFDYAELGSTNDEAKLLTKEAKGHKYIVTAQKQTSGRGRRGKSWVGLDGNLFMSLGVEAELKDFGPMIFVVSLSLLETIRRLSPDVDVKLKWPNDVLVNSRKVSGILLEKGEGKYLVIGIGVNITAAPQIDGLIYPTVSLREAGINTDRLTVLKQYIGIFDANWQAWKSSGFEKIRQRWLAEVKGLGCEIKVHTEKEDKTGIFSGIDENGIMLLENNGRIEKIYAGDIFYLYKNESEKKG